MLDDTKKCPYCAEIIKVEAVVCRFCGRDLVVPASSEISPEVTTIETPQKTKKRSGMKLILVIVIGLFLTCCGLSFMMSLLSDPSETDSASSVSNSVTSDDNAEESSQSDTSATDENDVQSDNAAKPTNSPQPTNTPEPDGSAPENAIPFGTKGVSGNYVLSIDQTERPADKTIEEANMFNSEPEPGNEFIMVQLTAECTEDGDKTCTLNPLLDIELFGSKGIVQEPDIFVSGVPHMLEDSEFFGGSSVTGWLVFEVGQDETDFILKFVPGFSFMIPIYLEVPDTATE